MGNILLDANNRPYPQYENKTTGNFEKVKGIGGAPLAILVDSNGSLLFVDGNPGKTDIIDRLNRVLGQVVVSSMPEVEIKNDSGNPLITDVTDRPARALGKVVADDGSLATIGLKADAAVTDPTASGSVVALLKGIEKYLRGEGTGRLPTKDDSAMLTTAPVTTYVTVTESPVEIYTGNSYKMVAIVNPDPILTASIGEMNMTAANEKGVILEPGSRLEAPLTIGTTVTIYGRSNGAAVRLRVEKYT